MPVNVVREQRLLAEEQKFDPDHYIADLIDAGMINEVLRFKPWWRELYDSRKPVEQATDDNDRAIVITARRDNPFSVEFNDDLKREMMQLPNKECKQKKIQIFFNTFWF